MHNALLTFVFAKRGSEASSEPSDAPPPKRQIVRDDDVERDAMAAALADLRGENTRPDDAIEDDVFVDDDDDLEMGDDVDAAQLRQFFELPFVGDEGQAAAPVVPRLMSDTLWMQTESELLLAPLPERIHTIHNDLQNKYFIDVQGHNQPIPAQLEARETAWILTRLTELTLARHHTEAKAIASSQQTKLAPLSTIQRVLTLVRDEHFEPSFIMMYHQEEMQPLLRLTHGFPFDRDDRYPQYIATDSQWPHTDYAFCKSCGARQPPIVAAYENSRFLSYPTQCRNCSGGDTLVRKACSIQLGRLLWDIVELDIRFIRTARRMSQIMNAIPSDTTVREERGLGAYI